MNWSRADETFEQRAASTSRRRGEEQKETRTAVDFLYLGRRSHGSWGPPFLAGGRENSLFGDCLGQGGGHPRANPGRPEREKEKAKEKKSQPNPLAGGDGERAKLPFSLLGFCWVWEVVGSFWPVSVEEGRTWVT